MRKIIKEELDNFKFERMRKIILTLLNNTVLPKNKCLCGFDVERLDNSVYPDSIKIIIKFKPDSGRYKTQNEREEIANDVWAYVYDYLGIQTYLKLIYDESCEKYTLLESKREDYMFDYFNKLFKIDELKVHHPYNFDDETGDEYEDSSAYNFYFGDMFDDETAFKYYRKEYFFRYTPYYNSAPLLQIEKKYKDVLDGYFGDLWKESIKKWFHDNFGMKVKTVE